MAFLKSSRGSKPEPEVPNPNASAESGRKSRPTPTRKEAEAARMARLHPELDPKKAKAMNREAQAQQRLTQQKAIEGTPERQLMRDVVDSRWNMGEVALPLMLLILMVAFVPQLQTYYSVVVYIMWGVIALIVIDWFVMWRKYKKLAAQRFPDRSLKGMGFYGWNRQMAFRRWRVPPPRIKRGQTIE